jgi:hypothetical protein
MMKRLSFLAAALAALSCGPRPTFEQAAADLFEGRTDHAVRAIRALEPEIAAGGLAADDLHPFTDEELQAIAKQTAPPPDEKLRFQLSPRGLIASREPTFLWEASGKGNVTIKIANESGEEEGSFDVADMAPYRPAALSLPRGTTHRWAVFDIAGNPISDWLEFTIANDDMARQQQTLLSFLSTRVSQPAHRSLLSVQFYRRQKLYAECLGILEYLAKEYPQNARVRLEMAACLAQLGNDYAAKAFADGAFGAAR